MRQGKVLNFLGAGRVVFEEVGQTLSVDNKKKEAEKVKRRVDEMHAEIKALRMRQAALEREIEADEQSVGSVGLGALNVQEEDTNAMETINE